MTIDPDVMLKIQTQKFLDASKQVRAIQKNRASVAPIATYKERETVSGFREVSLSTGGLLYTRYRSNAAIEPDQVIPGFTNRINDQGIGTIDIKPS